MKRKTSNKETADKIKAEKVIVNGKDMQAEVAQIKQASLQRAQSTLRKMWGKQKKVYETFKADEYEKFLRTSPLMDIYKECQRVGIVPASGKERNITMLMKKFHQFIAAVETQDLVRQPDRPISDRGMRILKKFAAE